MSKTKIKGKQRKAKEYQRFLIHIPSAMAKDSQFPFKPGQEPLITVDPRGKIVLTGQEHGSIGAYSTAFCINLGNRRAKLSAKLRCIKISSEII